MQVILAGFNIDSSLIARLQADNATPEVISAAYARVSRSQKTVTQLRAEALEEIAKARNSNRNIIFGLGHASVAEHAVFNLDLIGISRLLTDSVETLRLASFTEKSQRYVTFSNDFVIPAELDAPEHSSLRRDYIDCLSRLFDAYKDSIADLKRIYRQEFPDLSAEQISGKAKEDARYILPLATKTQLGMTINARSLENLLQRLSAHPLREAGELRRQLLEPVQSLCPSLVRYTEPDAFSGSFAPDSCHPLPDAFPAGSGVRVLSTTPDADAVILAALLYELSGAGFNSCRQRISSLDIPDRQHLWDEVFAEMKPWSKMPRAFELADFTLELSMTESCWAQFKRHRMGTLLKKSDPSIGGSVYPQAIATGASLGRWEQLKTERIALAARLSAVSPALAGYARSNADLVRVVAKFNLRELYHFVRLRSDAHAQWEINALSHLIARHIREFAPQAASRLCGKSDLEA